MTDMVTRLRRVAYVMFDDGWQSRELASDAAAEIERLRAALKSHEDKSAMRGEEKAE